MEALLDVDLDTVCQLSQNGYYDFAVIGSGIGGGILTQKLVKEGKKVLLLERGGLLFSSHCLNTSRPHWQRGETKGPSQDNEVVYGRVKAKVELAEGSDPYAGGPVYCLGGRSTVWGLFSPKIDDHTLETHFPPGVKNALSETWYEEALKLFSWHAKSYPDIPGAEDMPEERSEVEFKRGCLKRAVNHFANMDQDSQAGSRSIGAKVEVAIVEAEFIPLWWYTIPQGAYSTVDYFLELLYAKNPFLTVVLNAEVLSLEMDKNRLHIENVIFRDKFQHIRRVRGKSAVVLSAGTIDSARIALRSSLPRSCEPPLVGKGIMDHEIWGVRIKTSKELRKRPPTVPPGRLPAQVPTTPVHHSSLQQDGMATASKQPLKLQCMVTICEQPALLNVCINADNFLGRGAPILQGDYCADDDDFFEVGSETNPVCNTLNITLQYGAELDNGNEVRNDPGLCPVLKIKREGILGGPSKRADRREWMKSMQTLVTQIMKEFLDGIEDDSDSERQNDESFPPLKLADFGVVAHEVGTMRMGHRDKNGSTGVVDENLKFMGLDNLYVCDLSVFPYSAPANPTLTLAALALRLADKLVKRYETRAVYEQERGACLPRT